MPIPVAALMMQKLCDSGYPERFMAGIIMEPMADASAIEDPEIPEKRISETTTAIPRPPRMWPTIPLARFTNRRDIPPVSIKSPARIKKGTARNGKWSIPEFIFWSIIMIGRSKTHNPRREMRIMLKATGMPKNIKMKNSPNKIQIIFSPEK